MKYDFIAIREPEIPQAVEPVFQHVITTYAGEANKTVGLWRHVPEGVLDYKPHDKTNSIRTILIHQLLSERRFFAQFVGTEEPPVEELLPAGEKPVVQAYIDKYLWLVRRRFPQLAAGTTLWWLEQRNFFGDLQRERIWIFWRHSTTYVPSQDTGTILAAFGRAACPNNLWTFRRCDVERSGSNLFIGGSKARRHIAQPPSDDNAMIHLPNLLFAAVNEQVSLVFIELGAAVMGLAVLARLAHWLGFSAIPLYLLGGLAFGNGGLIPLQFTQEFVHVGAEIGVILLLFMLGLEYSGEELRANLRSGFPAGMVDFALNFPPGFIAGLLLGWSPLAAVLLGGVTYISSSGIIARVLEELKRLNNPETPTILSLLVLEDLAMAVYLPLVAVLLIGQGLLAGIMSVLVALITVSVVLFVALRYGKALSRLVAHGSDEVILLSTFGLVLVVAGIAQRLQVSAAVGAFLVGVARYPAPL